MTHRIPLLLLALLTAAIPAPLRAQASATAEVEPYRLGPGDELEISIVGGGGGGGEQGGGGTSHKLNFPVAGDGFIDVIGAGKVKVNGLTASEVADRIRARLQATGYYARPFVSVNVTKYLSQCVNVAGAVEKQGRYCLQGPTRLIDILSQAEGVKEEEAGRVIIVNRQGAAEPIRVDRRELVGGDVAKSQAANIRVLAGDNIYVPVKSRVCIAGPLEEAGCYSFDEGATLHEAIAMAGGLKQDTADRTKVTIRRHDGTEVKVDLDQLAATGAPAPLLEAGDNITIADLKKLRFCVNGQVDKADCYEDVAGVTIEGAISKAGGLVPNKADRNHIEVRRLVDGRQKQFTIDLDKEGPEGTDFLVLVDDQIVVPALDCVISVTGGVRQAQQVEYKTGMTLTDALSAAGGTTNEQGFALGKLNAVVLRRGDSVQTIDARAIMRGRGKDVLLQCGDRILVPTRGIGGFGGGGT